MSSIRAWWVYEAIKHPWALRGSTIEPEPPYKGVEIMLRKL